MTTSLALLCLSWMRVVMLLVGATAKGWDEGG